MSYFIMRRDVIQDEKITLDSLGLLGYALSLPETWEYSVPGLMYSTGEGKHTIQKSITNLIDAGYLERERRSARGSSYTYVWHGKYCGQSGRKGTAKVPATAMQDKSISLSARGLYLYALSLPEKWEYSVHGLAACTKAKPGTIKKAVKDLQRAGYLKIKRHGTGYGKIKVAYQWTSFDGFTAEKKADEKQAHDAKKPYFTGFTAEKVTHDNVISTAEKQAHDAKKPYFDGFTAEKKADEKKADEKKADEKQARKEINNKEIRYIRNNPYKRMELPEYMNVPIEAKEATIPEETSKAFIGLVRDEKFIKANGTQRLNMLRATCSTYNIQLSDIAPVLKEEGVVIKE